jgi:hypothetical protein
VEENKAEDQEFEEGGMNSWIQNNLRIIISIAIVVAIAGGIYSYSKRTQTLTTSRDGVEEQIIEKGGPIAKTEEGQSVAQNQEKASQDLKTGEKNITQKETATSEAVSQETEGSFIETSIRGDGTTHLARRALANYLEKNPDSGLTPEHKIYIEDYLRKHVGFKGQVRIGTSVEFSKQLIQDAITQSKTLNDAQLKNLHKYAVMVPSLL